MHIILHILAVIGLILLCILGLVLLLVLAVLFIPVRYRIRFSYIGRESVEGRLTWLFRGIHIPFAYRQGKTSYELRVLGIDLSKLLFSHPSDTSHKKKKKAVTKRKKSPARQEKQQKGTDAKAETESKQAEEESKRAERKATEEENREQMSIPAQESSERKVSPFRKWLNKIKQAVSLLKELWEKWLRLLAKEKEFAGRLKKYIAFLKDDCVSDMVCILKENVLHLWKKLKPKSVKGYIRFGTGDPCTTGEILGVMSFLYVASRGELRVQPEFEQTCFEGEMEIRGRITVFSVLWIIYQVVFSEEWDKFQKAYRKVRR